MTKMKQKKLAYIMSLAIMLSPGVCFSDENTNDGNTNTDRIALKLVGTVVNTSGTNMALVEDISCSTRLVMEKEFIPDVGTIKTIEKNHIVVAYNQKEFNIRINNSSRVDEVCRVDLHEPTVVEDEANAQQETTQHPSEETNIRQEPLDQDALEQEVYDANNRLTGSQVKPYMEEDGFIGFALTEVNGGGLFQGLGLKADDIITEVNAVKKDQPSEMLQSLVTMSDSGPPAKFSILREGKRVSFSVNDEEAIKRIRSILSKRTEETPGR